MPDALYREVVSAAPYAGLERADFDRIVEFVATGGYALRAYERYARLRPTGDGRLRLSHPRLAQQYRMNVGTIVEAPMIKIRLVGRASARRRPGKAAKLAGGRVLGELEEYFINQLSVGDTFAFAGEVLRFEGLQDTEAFVTRTSDPEPMIPSYEGGKFPLSTHLAQRVRAHARRSGASGARCPRPSANGWRSRPSARPFPMPARCWSRRSRAATATSWWSIRSRAGSRTRRSACC